MTLTWRDLFIQTLRDPAAASQFVLGLPLTRAELYMALIAGAACNAVLTGIMTFLFPPPQGFPAFFLHPVSYFVIVAGGLVLFAHILTWAGRAMGGQGGLDELLKLVIWLQFVRIALQSIGLVLTVALPMLGGLYSLAVAALSIWIFLHFVKSGHVLQTLGHAALILFVTLIGLVIGLSILLALAGVAPMGVPLNV